MIENTQDPGSIHATALRAFAVGDTAAVIEGQERAGQAQLVTADVLPTNLDGHDQADFEALGFTFGDPTPSDPMFRQATLPDGWKREASDHAMWSYVTDPLGRRRVSIFYKAAFYDRHAFMRLDTLHNYVSGCLHHDTPIVTDDTWATPAALAQTLHDLADRAQRNVDTWQTVAERDGEDDETRAYVAEYTAERDKCLALAAGFEAVNEA